MFTKKLKNKKMWQKHKSRVGQAQKTGGRGHHLICKIITYTNSILDIPYLKQCLKNKSSSLLLIPQQCARLRGIANQGGIVHYKSPVIIMSSETD